MGSTILGERLKQAREDMGLTQAALGGMIGAKAANISAYEKGVNTPPLETANKLALLLGVSLEWLSGLSSMMVTGTQLLTTLAFCEYLLPPDMCQWDIEQVKDDDESAGSQVVLRISDDNVLEFARLVKLMEKPLPKGLWHSDERQKMLETTTKLYIDVYGRKIDENSQRIQALRAQYKEKKQSKNKEEK